MEVADVKNVFLSGEVDEYVAPPESSASPSYELGGDYFRVINGGKVAGFDFGRFSDVSQIYDFMYDNDRDLVISFSIQSIEYFNATNLIQVLANQSKVVFRVRGKDNKTYFYLRHGIANGILNGKLVRNYTYLEDVTWMQPRSGQWQLLGPEADYFDFDIPEITSFKGVLSPGEIRVLKLVARGFHSRDIAEGLKLSRHTVDTHRRNMLKKMDAANTPELLTLARDMNLI